MVNAGQEAAAWSGDAARFSAFLKAAQQDFLVCGETGDQQVRVRFTGPWRGREVVWDCCFVTLACESRQTGSRASASKHNYIDIGEPAASGIPLRVCLDLACIDLPAIRKMMIMIRNYKYLQPGRHVFGEHGISPSP